MMGDANFLTERAIRRPDYRNLRFTTGLVLAPLLCYDLEARKVYLLRSYHFSNSELAEGSERFWCSGLRPGLSWGTSSPVNKTTIDMVMPNDHPKIMRTRGFPEASEITFSTSPNSKVQTAWNTVKTNFKDRSSAPDLRRWMSFTRTSEPGPPEDLKATVGPRPEDERNSLFCDSLLGLMERTRRFDYLDFTREPVKRRNSERSENNPDQTPRAKRFSWTR